MCWSFSAGDALNCPWHLEPVAEAGGLGSEGDAVKKEERQQVERNTACVSIEN